MDISVCCKWRNAQYTGVSNAEEETILCVSHLLFMVPLLVLVEHAIYLDRGLTGKYGSEQWDIGEVWGWPLQAL